MRWGMELCVGFLAVFFSGLMAFQKSLYSAAICLLAALLQVALIFSLSGSPLLGLMQMMIYAGAVMVLVVVVIMAFPKPAMSKWGDFFLPKPLAALLLIGFFAELILSLSHAQENAVSSPMLGRALSYGLGNATSSPMLGRALSVGSVLFGSYAPATEAATLLMFLAGLALVGEGEKR